MSWSRERAYLQHDLVEIGIAGDGLVVELQ